MSDLVGITNENEYYSDHYLAEILEKDLKSITETKDSFTDAERDLRTIAREYPKRRHEWEHATGAEGRLRLQRSWCENLLNVLGYEPSLSFHPIDDECELPAWSVELGGDGRAHLLVFECVEDADTSLVDPLALALLRLQFGNTTVPWPGLIDNSWETLLDDRIFKASHPPRWVMLLSVSQLVLIDRYKWPQKRHLRVVFNDLFDRVGSTNFNYSIRVAIALHHKASLSDSDGRSLAEQLNANSLQHAYSVSTDLKYALRTAIEVLANEVVEQRKHVRLPDLTVEDAPLLGQECLRFMYRLLFLFFLEARPELNLAPLKSDVYRQGYSLGHLRDLELTDLATEKARDGFYFHESLSQLFQLVHKGYGDSVSGDDVANELALDHAKIFTMRRINSRLFDDEQLPMLGEVRIRNLVLQQIIRLLSLSQPLHGKRRGHRGRGRISYSQLGVNQLGAVYEALLPYRGIFAEIDLYEVSKKPGDPLEPTYLVSAEDIQYYDESVRVFNQDERGNRILQKHSKGSFLFRLAGRDRERTASYYTPESLTRCVVKYSLEELISEDMSASDIMNLSVCEPAMGSAAFLNEAINQLADRYLEQRQLELNCRIPATDFHNEQRRVRQFIADRNVHGVDVNPLARELGELSLWLNCMHENGHVPWFGYQLKTGNSIIGSRRAYYTKTDLESTNRAWTKREPSIVGDEESTDADTTHVYHFLLPSPDMLAFKPAAKDKSKVDQILPNWPKELVQWRKPFNQKHSPDELETLCMLSHVIDQLWSAHVEQVQLERRHTEDALDYWGSQTADLTESSVSGYSEKDAIQKLGTYNTGSLSAPPYRRLKFVMDYWCALWFWPLEKQDLLPDRASWISEVTFVLTGRLPKTRKAPGELFETESIALIEQRKTLDAKLEEVGHLDWDQLKSLYPRIPLVESIASKHRFMHWDLEFADVFYPNPQTRLRSGFDLVLGNPPWVVPSFDEAGLLSDRDPSLAVKKTAAPAISVRALEMIEEESGFQDIWFDEWQTTEAVKQYLSSAQNYECLRKLQVNLYKPFLRQSWLLQKAEGVTGLLYPDSVYDDPKGQQLRQQIYPRLRRHFQFHNSKGLFHDIHSMVVFGIHIMGDKTKQVLFDHVANLYLPETIDGCYAHHGDGVVKGLKTETNDFNVAPHHRRIVSIDEHKLATFAEITDKPGIPPKQARLLRVHSTDSMQVIEKLASYQHRLSDLDNSTFHSRMWEETGSINDGTIQRDTKFVESWEEFIYSGPHFFVANPFAKTPREFCNHRNDYDSLDLEFIPNDYIPRTNYVRSCDKATYQQRIQNLPWSNRAEKLTSQYRFGCRSMVYPANERTLIPLILPANACHVSSLQSVAFKSNRDVLDLAGFLSAIPVDYIGRTSGVINYRPGNLRVLPRTAKDLNSSPLIDAIRIRTLALNCLTVAYSDLWGEMTSTFDEEKGRTALYGFQQDSWTSSVNGIQREYFSRLSEKWVRSSALRNDRERRQALIEIDVLAAMLLGLTLDELIATYNEQFSVLASNERSTWYDSCGRIVATDRNSGYVVKIPQTAAEDDTCWVIQSDERYESNIAISWDDVKHMKNGTVSVNICDNTLPSGPINRTIDFHAPFTKPDRISDYETAWAEFERRFSN